MAFVVSDGALQSVSRPLQQSAVSVDLSTPTVFTNDRNVDYLELWRKQRAVRTTVSFLARNIAQLGIHAFRRDSDTDRPRLDQAHPLSRVLRSPNPVTTRYRLMDALVHDLAIFDRAYWLKAGNSSTPTVIRIPPSMVTPKGDNWLTPTEFEVRGTSGASRVFKRDQVVYFRGYAGVNDFGSSPIESLRQILAEEYAGTKARAEILRNGTRASGYIERPVEAKPWTEEGRTRFARQWRTQYAGDGPEAGGTPILEEGMTFRDATQTSRDLQYIETRKLTREEVAAVYFVPPPMVGILDKATFSNITEQHKMLYQDTLGPWLTMISEEIALQLIPDIAPTEPNIYVEFNLREKLTGNFEERQDAITKAVGGPTLTINEARALDNRPPIDGGNELIRPLNVTQNGDDQPIEAEPAPTPDDVDPDDEQEEHTDD